MEAEAVNARADAILADLAERRRARIDRETSQEDENMKTMVLEMRLPIEDEHAALIEQFAAAAGQRSGEFMTDLMASHVPAIMVLLLRDLKRMSDATN